MKNFDIETLTVEELTLVDGGYSASQPVGDIGTTDFDRYTGDTELDWLITADDK